jgi:hypothetical protein
MAIKLGGGGGGSASQINEVVLLNDTADLVTLSDGRKYLKGGVFETTLSTYPDATTSFVYAGNNFSFASQTTYNPLAMTSDSTHYYLLDFNDRVYKYTKAGVYVTSYAFTGAGVGIALLNVDGIEWDGTHFWAVDYGNDRVYKFNSSWVYQNVSYDISAQSTTPQGITWDGTNWWLLDNNRTVYKYNSSWVYQNVSFSIGGQQNYVPDITTDGSYLYVLKGASSKGLSKFTFAGVEQEEINIDSIMGNEGGVTWDGTYFQIASQQNDLVYQIQRANGIPSVTDLGAQNYVRVL